MMIYASVAITAIAFSALLYVINKNTTAFDLIFLMVGMSLPLVALILVGTDFYLKEMIPLIVGYAFLCLTAVVMYRRAKKALIQT
ncbi:MAG: hypothetical protein A3B74_00925 [Candidatus Kerfeldbacteria bacterium RIFCSPHIGHO2_02_FULL_42_14]|uniref:Uncharacterized protein n=1 Tax=Candidatus Kerfeldbacteria bacterium RIFCSPHIGHO2_02_FULL_42_14 TaxID=1798540 RepID=A0A1G2AR53_9BACT|nr:MAG: hypothetical protein A3B74_00925 [Candidatus Kerfeldbacteria bacterium RIFCSPHIGHO2_02_FULL_42_14]OGY81916.1 MAG: hypothetical protein A3E60_01005 [Candidatus Kerfeldbacteria bacterium RIFCSPHIGHO2_12_FULL_42_13]OGY83449.1 MAG: hypothetical protein A3I91_02250 [Candidatus Kerfeldbacteria bacterium RIFCSPLOWO2_02_FULL_42_19]OGY87025.1 MAG: hypothetical protein A3G01_01960 [Candidatus Kerfeldbacteria bacterium RIFCSPLOWO2_12_FULL_43_9]